MHCHCSDFQSRLADYADGELGECDQREVQTHLAECAGCREALGELRWIDTLLSESLREAPGEGWLTLPGDETAATPNGLPRFRWARPALAAAAGLLALAAWGLSRNGSDERRQPNQYHVAAKSARPAASPPAEPASERLEWAALQAEIEREANAARLAASAEVLAGQAGADVYALDSWRLLAETFPETHAGRDAARRVESSRGERSEAPE
ncbi:MAG TPA: zf-HC2 domain-containing protein [Pirellulales bacterium]|nr:zf-HC2 domain-containing protein [Pirellulales bacterium]